MKTMALLAILAGGLWSLGVSTPPAEATLLQQQIDHVLLEYPGGVQTGPGEVTWGGGEVVLELEDPARGPLTVATMAVGSCATDHFCAYTNINLTGAKITFSNCNATNSVSPLGSKVRSFANARSSGTVYAYNGSTVVASTYKNTTATVTRLGC